MRKIAILRLPFTGRRDEFLPLRGDPCLDAQWVRPNEFQDVFPRGVDVIILPGSGASVRDLEYLRSSGGARIVQKHLSGGGVVVGICGGYQILGQWLLDPFKRQGGRERIEGLGFLPISTLFGPKLVSIITTASLLHGDGSLVSGEEHRSGFSWESAPTDAYLPLSKVEQRLHHQSGAWRSRPGGQKYTCDTPEQPFQASFQRIEDIIWSPGSEPLDGHVSTDRQVWGTYLHLIFHNSAFTRAVISSRP